MSEWTKCQRKTCEPKRKAFKVPQEFRETYSFLNLYKFKDGLCRIIPNNPSTIKAANGNQANGNSSSKVSLNIFLQFLTPTIFSNLDSNWGHSITTWTRRGRGPVEVHAWSRDKDWVQCKMFTFAHLRGGGVKIG
jgi:hypothetical protein